MSRFVCLMYHNVCDDADLASAEGLYSGLSASIRSYFVSRSQFASHLQAIGTDRWASPDGLASSANETDAPRVLITFDDGWAGSIEEAGPLLAAVGAKALVFVTTGLIGHPLFATPEMLRSASSETFEFGAHTVTHPFLAESSSDVIRQELIDSRQRLEDILSRPVTTMSVPNGSLDERVREIARDAGYERLFTSEAHDNPLPAGFEVGRVAVRADTSVETIGRWSRGEIGGASWRRKALNLPKRWLGPSRYRVLRSWALGQADQENEMTELVRMGGRGWTKRSGGSPGRALPSDARGTMFK